MPRLDEELFTSYPERVTEKSSLLCIPYLKTNMIW